MKIAAAVLAMVAAAFVLGGCGSGAKPEAKTLAGVLVVTSRGRPRPSTPGACARRWNGAANTSGRAVAERRAPKAEAALIRRAATAGYFRGYAGRCLIYLVTSPGSAVVFVESERGTFDFTGDAAGRFRANADLLWGGRLRLR